MYRPYDQSFDMETAVARINTVCNCMYDKYINKYKNVVGFGLAIKVVNGTPINIPSLTFLVETKVPLDQLPAEDRIPQTIDGMVTDVVRVGKLVPFSSYYKNSYNNSNYNQSNYENYYVNSNYNKVIKNDETDKIAQGGESIGYIASPYPGTISCAVIDDEAIYALSSGHVLAGTGLETRSAGSPIIQPSEAKGGTASNYIGPLLKFIPTKYYNPTGLGSFVNVADAGLVYIGQLEYSDHISQNVLKKGLLNYGDLQVANVKLGDDISKFGAGSNETKGKVLLSNAVINLDINGHHAIYINQIVTSGMAKPGDSGSLGTLTYGGGAFGLLMGGSDVVTIYNPLKEALELLDVKIWN